MRWLAQVTDPDSMARAKELLDLVKSPTAVATGVLLAYAQTQLSANSPIKIDRTVWATVAAVGGAVIAGAVVAVMFPLTWRVLVTNYGNGVETRLLVYVLTWLVAIGTLAFALKVLWQAIGDLKNYQKPDEDVSHAPDPVDDPAAAEADHTSEQLGLDGNWKR